MVKDKGVAKPKAATFDAWDNPPDYEEKHLGRIIETAPPVKNSWMTESSGFNDPYPVEKIQKTPVESFVVYEAKGPTIFDSFCTRVSVAGLNKVSDPEYGTFRRLLWLLLILGCFGFGIFQCSTQILQFSKRPVRVKVNVTRAKELEFPTLTFCNFNMWKKTPSEDDEITEIVWIIINQVRVPYIDVDKLDIQEFKNWTELYMKYGHQKKDSIMLCSWLHKKCTPADFRQVTTDMGWCFQFNYGSPLLKVENAGSNFGLQLHLIVEANEYLAGTSGPGVGFKILPHDPYEIPLMRPSGIAAGPGMQTFIGLKKKRVENLPPKYGSCGDRALKYFTNYTTSACFVECKTDYMVKNCGCKLDYYPGNFRFCNPKDLYNCAFERDKMFVTDPNQTCTDKCPDQCKTNIYETDVSAVPIKPDYFEGLIFKYNLRTTYNPDITNETLAKNLAVVNIFYRDMNVEETIQQPAYTPIDMFCDIGGSFGLVLGASVLTVLDIVDFLVYYFVTRKMTPRVSVAK